MGRIKKIVDLDLNFNANPNMQNLRMMKYYKDFP